MCENERRSVRSREQEDERTRSERDDASAARRPPLGGVRGSACTRAPLVAAPCWPPPPPPTDLRRPERRVADGAVHTELGPSRWAVRRAPIGDVRGSTACPRPHPGLASAARKTASQGHTTFVLKGSRCINRKRHFHSRVLAGRRRLDPSTTNQSTDFPTWLEPAAPTDPVIIIQTRGRPPGDRETAAAAAARLTVARRASACVCG